MGIFDTNCLRRILGVDVVDTTGNPETGVMWKQEEYVRMNGPKCSKMFGHMERTDDVRRTKRINRARERERERV